MDQTVFQQPIEGELCESHSVSAANRSRADRCVGLQVRWREDLGEAGSSGAAALRSSLHLT